MSQILKLVSVLLWFELGTALANGGISAGGGDMSWYGGSVLDIRTIIDSNELREFAATRANEGITKVKIVHSNLYKVTIGSGCVVKVELEKNPNSSVEDIDGKRVASISDCAP